MKILIGYDGVHPTQNLIDDLKRAGLPKQTEAVVMTLVDAVRPPSGTYSEISIPESTVAYIEEMRAVTEARLKKELVQAQKTAEKAAKSLQAAFREWTVCSEACIDSPAWGLIKKADKWKPDLTVVGSHGATAVAGFFLGSVSRNVVVNSRGSIRIVRKHRKTKHPVRILIGMDGSADSETAVRSVSERSWPQGTQVRLVTVFDQNMVSALAFHPQTASLKQVSSGKSGEENWAREMTAPFTKRLEKAGLKVETIIKAGKPWKVLVKEAESWKADCIFVGARGLGMVSRFLLGSVSSAVASRAHCSVEVVREKI